MKEILINQLVLPAPLASAFARAIAISRRIFFLFRRPLVKAEKERLKIGRQGSTKDGADIRDEVKKDAKMMTGSPRMQ